MTLTEIMNFGATGTVTLQRFVSEGAMIDTCVSEGVIGTMAEICVDQGVFETMTEICKCLDVT